MNQVTDKQGNNLEPAKVIHPGVVLEKELEERGIKKSAFALDIHMYPAHLSEILSGKRNVSPATAIKLENALGIEAAYWLRIQNKFDLAKQRIANTFQDVSNDLKSL